MPCPARTKGGPRDRYPYSAALGLTNAEIATRLSITVHAIKFHLASIYRKLGVGNRTEAAVSFLTLKNQGTAI